MIDPKYATNCLKRGFQRYIRYSKINASIDSEPYRVSFYVKDYDKAGKQYLARSSDHHLKMQRMADKDEPWKGDNVSIDFIVPDSEQDKKKLRARVEQNASGTIQPFDVTTYQYDSTLIDPTDITTIFKAIIVFLNGGGYTDPFIGTPKQAKTLPRHSNIKPHRGSASSTPLTCSKNISIDENYLNEMTIYCLGDIIPLNENKQYNKNRNMKQTIRLTESDLKQIVKESVNKILNEAYGTMPHNDLLMHYDYSPYEDKSLDANLNDTGYHKKGDIPRYYNWVPDLAKAYGEFKKVANEAYPYSYVGKRYMEKLRKELHNIEDILNRVIKIEKMDLGLDPYSPNIRNDRNYTKPKEGYILNPNRWYQNQSPTIPNPNHPPKS